MAESRSAILLNCEDNLSRILQILLNGEGCSPLVAASVDQVAELLKKTQPNLVIVQLGRRGNEFDAGCNSLFSACTSAGMPLVAVVTGESEVEAAERAEFNFSDMWRAPLNSAEVRIRLRSLLRLRDLELLNQRLVHQMEGLSNVALDAIVAMDCAGKVTYWNPAATRMFGYNETEALHQDLHDLIAPQRYHSQMRQAFEGFRLTGHGAAIGRTLELVAVRADGSEFPVELSLASMKIGDQFGAVAIVRETSARQHAEAQLRESEALQRLLLDNMTVGVLIVDAETRRVERMNRAAEMLLGTKTETICASLCQAAGCSGARITCPVLDLQHAIDHDEAELVRADGTRLPVLKTVRAVVLEGRPKLLETLVDLSDQKLRDGLYRAIFDYSFDAVMTIHDGTRSFSSANPAALALFGVDNEYNFLVRAPKEYSPELQPDGRDSGQEFDRLLDVALREGHVAFDWIHRRLDGNEFEASVLFVRMRHGTTAQIQVIVRDVSEQRRVARQLEQERLACERMELEMRATQKLEAVGQLAAGIAHEINTPTQFASDSVNFLKEVIAAQAALLEKAEELKARSRRGESSAVLIDEFDKTLCDLDIEYFLEQGPIAVESASDGLSRIAAIVRAMKEFSHPDSTEKTAVDLNAALRNTLTIARNEYKYVAEIEVELGALPPVVCHAGALNQVFLNLIVNAAHAIADRTGNSGEMGRIGLRTQLEGSSVRIDISDTGTGIPEAIRERIFEPFFTTKEVGRGTGQGLAIARSIVCGRHGGTIAFDTAEGKGTTFTVRIPVEGDAS